jgi:hypothetical protein
VFHTNKLFDLGRNVQKRRQKCVYELGGLKKALLTLLETDSMEEVILFYTHYSLMLNKGYFDKGYKLRTYVFSKHALKNNLSAIVPFKGGF